MPDLTRHIDKAHSAKELTELADAPVAALKGVSESDAQHLKDAFDIVSVRDLGTNKHFLAAQAIAHLAG